MIRAISAFEDNYIWAIEETRERSGDPLCVAVVDPGDPGPVLDHIVRHDLTLAAILVTHHHGDHVGGLAALKAHARRARPHAILPIYGPANESIAEVNVPVQEGDVVEMDALNCRLSVIETPGHTRGHIAYFGFCGDSQPVLFCGDTLFAGGCGRLFEGTADQMWGSLHKLARLPPDTQLYCAHEYTLSNLRFARHVMPEDADIDARYRQVELLRSKSLITLPSTIATEQATNVFLRCNTAEQFAELRKRKDDFRG